MNNQEKIEKMFISKSLLEVATKNNNIVGYAALFGHYMAAHKTDSNRSGVRLHNETLRFYLGRYNPTRFNEILITTVDAYIPGVASKRYRLRPKYMPSETNPIVEVDLTQINMNSYQCKRWEAIKNRAEDRKNKLVEQDPMFEQALKSSDNHLDIIRKGLRGSDIATDFPGCTTDQINQLILATNNDWGAIETPSEEIRNKYNLSNKNGRVHLPANSLPKNAEMIALARAGHNKLYRLDIAQCHLTALAHYSNDEALQAALAGGTDVYSECAGTLTRSAAKEQLQTFFNDSTLRSVYNQTATRFISKYPVAASFIIELKKNNHALHHLGNDFERTIISAIIDQISVRKRNQIVFEHDGLATLDRNVFDMLQAATGDIESLTGCDYIHFKFEEWTFEDGEVKTTEINNILPQQDENEIETEEEENLDIDTAFDFLSEPTCPHKELEKTLILIEQTKAELDMMIKKFEGKRVPRFDYQIFEAHKADLRLFEQKREELQNKLALN